MGAEPGRQAAAGAGGAAGRRARRARAGRADHRAGRRPHAGRSSTSPPPAAALKATVDGVRGLLDHAETAALESARICIRSLPADRLPAIGAVRDGLYVVATHSGITLAPLLGEIVAEELIADRASPALEGFRPGRFARPSTPAPPA